MRDLLRSSTIVFGFCGLTILLNSRPKKELGSLIEIEETNVPVSGSWYGAIPVILATTPDLAETIKLFNWSWSSPDGLS